jgi:membrane-bound lytic murein transglycosylase B
MEPRGRGSGCRFGRSFVKIVARRLLVCAAVLLAAAPAWGLDTSRPEVQSFIAMMVERHQFSSTDLTALLAQVETLQPILDAMAKPAEGALQWYEYRARFVTPQRIAQGIEFWQEHRELLDQVSQAQGVAPEYLVAILGVETTYGRSTGRYRVMDSLSTLAFDYPPRSKYFTAELEQFLLLAREESLDPRSALGSYAGAMGPLQFMPSSARKFAVDGDGDGKRDLFTDWADIVSSIAHYLRAHDWRPGEPVLAPAHICNCKLAALDMQALAANQTVASLRAQGVQFYTALPADAPAILIAAQEQEGPKYRVGFNNFRAILRYNQSPLYAMAVHDLATEILARVYSSDAQN